MSASSRPLSVPMQVDRAAGEQVDAGGDRRRPTSMAMSAPPSARAISPVYIPELKNGIMTTKPTT